MCENNRRDVNNKECNVEGRRVDGEKSPAIYVSWPCLFYEARINVQKNAFFFSRITQRFVILFPLVAYSIFIYSIRLFLPAIVRNTMLFSDTILYNSYQITH